MEYGTLLFLNNLIEFIIVDHKLCKENQATSMTGFNYDNNMLRMGHPRATE